MCGGDREKLILPTPTSSSLHHTYTLCLLDIHTNSLLEAHIPLGLRNVQAFWLGVWVLMPAAWVQILDLPLISHATLDRGCLAFWNFSSST